MRQGALTYKLMKSMIQPNLCSTFDMCHAYWVNFSSHKGVRELVFRRQRRRTFSVHLLQMDHRSTFQPTTHIAAKCPAISPLTHIDGAAQERAFLQCFLNDFEEVGWCLLQLIPFCNSTSEVLKAFSGGATRESLI